MMSLLVMPMRAEPYSISHKRFNASQRLVPGDWQGGWALAFVRGRATCIPPPEKDHVASRAPACEGPMPSDLGGAPGFALTKAGPSTTATPLLWLLDAAKAHVRHARVGTAAMSRAGTVARAVSVATQERTPFLHSQRRVWLARIVGLGRTHWVHRHAVAGTLTVEIHLVPVAAPLPNISCHVVEAIAVGRKGFDRRRP